MDQGFVMYQKENSGIVYDILYHCTCPKGQSYKLDNRKDGQGSFVQSVDWIPNMSNIAIENQRWLQGVKKMFQSGGDFKQCLTEAMRTVQSL
jgi:hypothetical protein